MQIIRTNRKRSEHLGLSAVSLQRRGRVLSRRHQRRPCQGYPDGLTQTLPEDAARWVRGTILEVKRIAVVPLCVINVLLK